MKVDDLLYHSQFGSNVDKLKFIYNEYKQSDIILFHLAQNDNCPSFILDLIHEFALAIKNKSNEDYNLFVKYLINNKNISVELRKKLNETISN